ncbi:hypothetical protein [Echinimonas agarilytica]|uniref:Uncharacterized protein n=1 Tax=Echinimonas agarilytica TaxID=1215918 RepID=A0AA41W6E7_9GAMM|nr:hypothetical protein [Echinimonas agarilytica]MCM2679424.1 hypothetical protein [Echinimonas agarilytica]
MASQDLIYSVLPRPLPKVEQDKSKVRQVSKRPVINNSDEERQDSTEEELDRVAKAMEQRDRQRKRHPQAENKKLKKLHQMQQKIVDSDDDTPHFDIIA